jgi:histidinol phosphatase-like enzyme
MNSVLFVEIPGVLIADAQASELLPGVANALQRFALRQVPVIAVSDRLHEAGADFSAHLQQLCHAASNNTNTELSHIIIADAQSPASWKKPRAGLILRGYQLSGCDLAHSWMIGTHTDDARAAANAGLAGAIIVGGHALPTDDLGIVVAAAENLADAPRVMIPRQGGCWHYQR